MGASLVGRIDGNELLFLFGGVTNKLGICSSSAWGHALKELGSCRSWIQNLQSAQLILV